jgi:hypothetical protein
MGRHLVEVGSVARSVWGAIGRFAVEDDGFGLVRE